MSGGMARDIPTAWPAKRSRSGHASSAKMEPHVAVDRMRDLTGTVLDPAVYEALAEVVGRRAALVFLDDQPA